MQTDLIEQKKAYYEDAEAQAAAMFRPTPWSLPQKVALSCRILARQGHNSSVAGQISALTEAGDTFWTQRYGLSLLQIAVSNLVRVDHDLKTVEGEGFANPANRFHKWIYRSRPDVRAIVHTHAVHASALAMLGEPLIASHMDTVALFDDVAHLPEWPGVPFGDEEGRIIAGTLGNCRAILLAHHGLLTVGRTLEEAVTRASIFEQAAKLQLLAMSAGSVRPLPRAIGLDGRAFADSPLYSPAHFEAWAAEAMPTDRDCLE